MKLTVVFFLLAVFLSAITTANAAVFTVNSNLDGGDINSGDGLCADASGNCTLRAAIQETNALSGADTINFSLSGASSITLASGELFITDNLTINGTGANSLTVNANYTSRIFNVLRNGINVTIRGLTAANGRASDFGGGIYSASANLTVENATVRNCFAQTSGGGIYSGSGALRLLNSTVENNFAAASGASGGGVSVNGEGSEIRNSRIIRNEARRGGGIVVGYYSTTISETLIADNSAGGGGGLLVTLAAAHVSNSTISGNTSQESGGGIALPYGNVVLVNSTVSGNRSTSGGGGGISTGTNGSVGYLSVRNSTIVNNTATYAGGLTGGLATATVIGNSIVANNSAGNAPNIFSTFTSLGGNLVNNRTGGDGYISTDLPDGTDPQIGALADNGGATPTHALLTGSSAINNGLNGNAVGVDGAPLTTDQRGAGFPRINGGTVDIGSFEAAAAAPATFIIVSGRAIASGRGIASARVSLTNLTTGERQTVTTNQSGYFYFQNVAAGQIYTAEISHKQYAFAAQTMMIEGKAFELNFAAQ